MTEAEIRHLIDSYIVDNQAHGITPAKTRDMMQQLVSYVVGLAGSITIPIPGISDVLDADAHMSGLNFVQTDGGGILQNEAGKQVIKMSGAQIELIGYNSPAGDAVGKITFNAITGKMRYYDGTEGDGKVLTSDADGNVTWQDAPIAPSTISITSQTVSSTIDPRTFGYTGLGFYMVCVSAYFHSVAGGDMIITLGFKNEAGDDELLTFYRQGITIPNMAIPGSVPIPPMIVKADGSSPIQVAFTVSGTMTYDASATLIKL